MFSFEEVNAKENYYPLIKNECLKNDIFFDWKQNKNILEEITVSRHITRAILIEWGYLLDEKIITLYWKKK